jgi:hypothetical protein
MDVDAQVLLGTVALSVGVFLGGSGIVGWYLTLRQLHEQRRREAQQTFRELVLPVVLDFLALTRSLKSFIEARVRVKKGQTAIVYTLKDYKQVESMQQWFRLFRYATRVRLQTLARIEKSGFTSLTPSGLSKRLDEAVIAMSRIESSILESRNVGDKEFDAVFDKLKIVDDELKRMVGLDVFESENRTNLVTRMKAKLT